MSRRWAVSLLVFALSCMPIACDDLGDDVVLQGSGATLPAPLYKRWFLEYYKRHPDVRVNYQAIGSGAGIRQFTERLVDFAASDAAMTDKEIEKIDAGVQLLPMTAGAIAVSYNLPDGMPVLRLSRKALVDIHLGKIEAWDDPQIARANPGVPLPSLPITCVHRSEGSGTTFVFTKHLSTISKEWEKGPGEGKSVVWPVGVGAKGNSGVAALISQTPGAIGYIEAGYAELTKLATAAIENKSGQFVQPNLESGKAALEGARMPPNYRLWISDPAGSASYPIVTYTWLLCYKEYRDARTASTLKDVIRFGLTEGQQWSADLGYIPLPENIVAQVLPALDNIRP
jgi:phosphate transport system substrate-binding protein